ncbi:MAG: hypothetical protein R3240_07935, partial [Gammaproteobacteria bacterium]|nr:hypothetical protein [Gammaproteobacteria bacterium]
TRWLILLLISIAAIACGEGEIKKPDQNTGLTFLNSNLEQFSSGVPITIPQIEIQVAEDLAPNSINSQTVQLMPGNGEAHNQQFDTAVGSSEGGNTSADESDILGGMDIVSGNVFYEQSRHVIIFQPTHPLAAGATYHLRVQNVRLSNGRAIEVIPRLDGTESGVIQFKFTTAHEHEILRIRYDKNGNETAYGVYKIENHIKKEFHQYSNTELRYSIEYDVTLPAPSTRTATKLFKDKNGEITQYVYEYVDSVNGLISLLVTKSGEDAIWGTDDDLVYKWSQVKQQHLSHLVTKNYKLINLNEPQVWQGITTQGFRLQNIELEEHGGPNFEHRYVYYKDLGANGEIDIDPVTHDLTAVDDNITLWNKVDFENGIRIRGWSIKGVEGKGADGQLFTDDDIATGLDVYQYFPADGSLKGGRMSKIISYYKSGISFPLNTWLLDATNNIVRSEEAVSSYLIFNYDNLGNKTEVLRYTTGDDMTMGTSQDYLTQRIIYSTLPTITGGAEYGLN